ncbi:MAG: hypothetical protein KAT28_01990 [Candidatus Aenigmarchaeota archaeon]|nr:hypothetical protein [Candidatus Aenigmarchaeota archaeon]
MKIHKKNKVSKKDLLIAILYLEILVSAFILPLMGFYSVLGLILSEVFYIILAYWLHPKLKTLNPTQKRKFNLGIIILFISLNLGIILEPYSLINGTYPTIKSISSYITLPALFSLFILTSHSLNHLEKIAKEAMEYISKIMIIITFLFLIISNNILFSQTVIEIIVIGICFILVSGVIGIAYLYEKVDSKKNKSDLRKSLLFSYSFFLLLLVFMMTSLSIITNLPLSLIY